MQLRISDEQLRLIADADNAVFLGIIDSKGDVFLRQADPVSMKGHHDWIAKGEIETRFRGFSVTVKLGRVRSLFAASIVNPTPDARLERDFIEQLVALFPIADQMKRVLNEAIA